MSLRDTPSVDGTLEERHRDALEALEEARERWRLILDTANDAYIAIDPDSRILDWNRQAEELFGWSTTEAVGQRLTELIIPERLDRRRVER